MSNADYYDTTEPVEKLPTLTRGKYKATIDQVVYNDFYESDIIELTINESEGKEAMKPGERAKWFLNLKVHSKKQAPNVVKRVKGFVYPALKRKQIPGDELDKLTREQTDVFAGKSIGVAIKDQLDEDGEPKLNNKTGEPWTEAYFFEA